MSESNALDDIPDRAKRRFKLGWKREEDAINIIVDEFGNNVEHISYPVDYIANGEYVEVKTCKELINVGKWEGVPVKEHGCFWISGNQHHRLKNLDGYYLFIVYRGSDVLKYEFIKACNIFIKKGHWPYKWSEIMGVKVC